MSDKLVQIWLIGELNDCALQYLIVCKRLGAVEDCVRVRRTGKPIDGRKAVQVRDAIN